MQVAEKKECVRGRETPGTLPAQTLPRGVPRVWRDKGAISLLITGQPWPRAGMQCLLGRQQVTDYSVWEEAAPYLIENPRGTVGGSLLIAHIEGELRA